ncbi:MAG: hypothetical protein JNK05_09375 [Myxococcales bacterium]|nr:hypothetical protein [Myxococcales bacterium]
MTVPPIVHSRSSDVAIASWRSLLVTRWSGRVTLAGLEQSFAVGRAIHKANPGSFCTFTIAPVSGGLPDEHARQRSAAMMKELGPVTKVGAVLLDGEGFLAGAARATLTTIQQLSGMRGYVRFVRDEAEAAGLFRDAIARATIDEVLATFAATR